MGILEKFLGFYDPLITTMGTRINDLQVTKVIDGDTIDVMLDGKEERLRLICIDTEESHAGGSKPVTNAGKLASEWTKNYFKENITCFKIFTAMNSF